ncbi:MAG: chemical-damaging agent resistance protein C [Epulopiscium sp. Nele67-Bin004]|nr:MAG: chemical-damaging agent resistance protein C [Epulopiscium sp. Nele67-Bin004]
MAISLKKGQKVDLTKRHPGLSQVVVGLGWDTNRFDTNGAFDLDTSVFLTGQNGRVSGSGDFVFYGNLVHPSGSVEHTGDNLTGAGDGDDEQIKVNLQQVPSHVDKIVFTVTIYESELRNQNFGMIQNAFIRIYNEQTNEVLLEYDLDEDFSIETAVVFGELYRHGGEWKFSAIGSGFNGGLGALCATYGVDVE